MYAEISVLVLYGRVSEIISLKIVGVCVHTIGDVCGGSGAGYSSPYFAVCYLF